ncbi:hypothetical protein Tco_0644226 [Tanacetum coccineum]
MTKTKSFDRNPKHKALYHALMESILEDEDAMDKGVADKLKKRKLDDADRDEDPPSGSNQGLKRRNTSKDAEPSKKVKSTDTSKSTTKSQLKSTSKSAQAEETVFEAGDTQVPHNLGEDTGKTDETPNVKDDPKDYKKPSKTFNELMSTPIDFTAFAMKRLQISDLTKADLGIEDMVAMLWSPIKVAYNRHALLVTNVKVNKWYDYGHLKEIEVQRSDKKLYKFMEGEFPRLYLNDIKDMLILIFQNRLFNLKGEDIAKTELTLEHTQQGVSDEVLVMRMATAAAKPYQGDSSEFYLITGSNPYGGSSWSKTSQIHSHMLILDQHIDEVLKLKNFKKDGYSSFQDKEKYEHVGPKVTSSQEGKRSQDDDKRLDLADDLKEA